LSRIRHFVPKFASLLILNSIVLPVYNYAITVWGFTYKIHIDSIVKLQRRAIKYINFSDRTAHSLPIFKKYNILNFEALLSYESIKYIYKVLNCLSSPYTIDFFKYKASAYKTRLQNNKCLEIPLFKLKQLQNSIFYAGVKNWNNLPLNLRNCKTFTKFCSELKSYLFGNMFLIFRVFYYVIFLFFFFLILKFFFFSLLYLCLWCWIC
jgi:hypothetical protein